MPERSLPAVTRTAEDGPARPAGSQPCLARVFIGDRPTAPAVRHPLGAVHQVTIGRGPDAAEVVADGRVRRLELRLADSWTSSAHVVIERALQRWVLRDAGSKNGTMINGLPAQRATLADGDVIEVGQTFFLSREALAGLGDAPAARTLPLSPTFDDVEDAGLACAAALRRLGQERVRFLPSAARLLIGAWPVDLDRCLRSALAAAAGAAIAPAHLPSQLPRTNPATAPRFQLEGEVFAIRFGDTTARLKDVDGLRYLAYLVERPAVEVHVLDLIALARGGKASADAPPDRSGAAGDAGPLLDAGAKAAYKQRLLDLREVLDEATDHNDHGRAARARDEIEALTAELSRAVGLGGRDRPAASSAERARVNVTLRIRGAMKRIAEACPPLGRHLEVSLRTGTFCSYQPVELAPPAR